MEKVYEIQYKESFRTLVLKDSYDLTLLESEEKKVISLIDENRASSIKPISDFIHFFNIGLLMKEAAYSQLKEILTDYGQWREMRYRETTLYFFLPNIVENIIDEDRSEFRYFEGYLIDVEKLCFKNVNIPLIFRVDKKYSPFLMVDEKLKGVLDGMNSGVLSFSEV